MSDYEAPDREETPEERMARLERHARERGLDLSTPSPSEVARERFDEDLIPDVLGDRPVTEEDRNIDELLAQVDILDAYARWCGKMTPKVGSKRESIMVSCPLPGHVDRDPSAWVNLDKQTGNCAVCGGFDKYDIAATHFDIDYRSNPSLFPQLRRAMAEDLGYYVTTGDVVKPITIEPDDEDDDDFAGGQPSNVISLHPEPEPEPGVDHSLIRIDWRAIAPEETFLRKWMEICSEDDLPEEFYFWLGLMALAMSCGEDAVLVDRKPVKGNFFLCLFGPSGMGKSRSTAALSRLLREALPYDHSDPKSIGALVLPQPQSAEALVDSFSRPIYDPADPSVIIGYGHVRGLVKFEEFATFAGKANRQGSGLKPQLTEIYDGENISVRGRMSGTVIAENPYCCVLSTTQPGSVKSVLANDDALSGFVNRWVFAMGVPKPLVAIGGEPLDITSTVQPLQSIHQWAHFGRKVKLDDAATRVWSEFFHQEIEPLKVGEDASPLLARIDLTLKKIMLLLALNEKTTVVTESIVQRATALLPYLKATYAHLDNSMTTTATSDCIDAITRILERRGRPMSARDIRRLLSKRFDTKAMVEALRLMEASGQVEKEVTKRGKVGRPTEKWSLVS